MWIVRDSGARSLATGVAFGVGALALDVAAVVVSNSGALRADLVRGAADTVASLFALLIYMLSGGPEAPARSAPRIAMWEHLSCVLTAVAIIAGVACMMWLLADRLANPVVIRGTVLGFIVATLNLIFNLWLLMLNRLARHHGQSPVIDAQARVIRMKLLANLTLFVTIGGATFAPSTTEQFASDSLGVLTQSAFGIWTATKLLRLHGGALMRGAPQPSERCQR